jgi:hypothetical protein
MKYTVGDESTRVNSLVRKELIINRLQSIEELREVFLEENNFDAANTLKNWYEEDWTELGQIEEALEYVEQVDGSVTDAMMKKVQNIVKEIQ